MALCTQVDYLTLKNWNFLKDYTRYRKHLDTIVRNVYYSASGILVTHQVLWNIWKNC